MKKVLKGIGIGIAAILVTVLTAAALAALVMVLETKLYSDGSTLPAEAEGISLDNWMASIKDDAPITAIAIPGAHDAGCIDMMWAYQTQNKTIAEQLAMGVRYFDIRIAADGDTCRIFHAAMKGVEAEPVLRDMRAFLRDNPSEFMIVDFQHFMYDDTFDSEPAALALAERTLGDAAIKVPDGVDESDYVKGLTLGKVRGKCLVVWGRTETSREHDWLFSRDNDDGDYADAALHSYYTTEYNVMASSTYIEQGLPVYWQKYNESNGGLFVLQGQLTDGLYVFGPASREISHDDNMNAYIAQMPIDKVTKVNVIMRDFVTPKKSILAIRLNLAKGYVRPEYREVVSNWG